MNENNNDYDFCKFLHDIMSAYDGDGDEKTDEEKPKEEVKTEKKEEKEEEKKEEPRNTKPNDWSFTASSSKPVDLDWLLDPGKDKQEFKPSSDKTDSCSVSTSKLWELHKSLTETVKRMNELTESMKSETARWMQVKEGIYSCNACNMYFTKEYNYCPSCGRKMYKALTPSGGKIFGA